MYAVRWKRAALDELAEIWVQASVSERREVTEAADTTETELRLDPLSIGEERADGRPILFAPPLGLIFRAVQDDRRVEVLHVWLLRRK